MVRYLVHLLSAFAFRERVRMSVPVYQSRMGIPIRVRLRMDLWPPCITMHGCSSVCWVSLSESTERSVECHK